MSMLFLKRSHEDLVDQTWSATYVKSRLSEIFRMTCQSFDAQKLWPTHPLDPAQSIVVPRTSFYSGAAGTIKALIEIAIFLESQDQLPDFYQSYSVIEKSFVTFERAFAKVVPVSQPFSGYLSGYCGLYLFKYWLGLEAGYDEFIVMANRALDSNYENELLLGLPGVLLASVFLHDLKQSKELENLIQKLINKLFATWQYCEELDCYLWQQDLYGEHTYQLGFLHGFAGNVFALLKARAFLSQENLAMIMQRAYKVLEVSQKVHGDLANFPQSVIKHRKNREAYLLQLCHGAPGFVFLLSELFAVNQSLPESMRQLLKSLGETIWQAGPLIKPNGLCHGNAGNGFAFLKLFEALKDSVWLDRARLFAMHAIHQQQLAEKLYAMPRFSYVTGDLGLAMFLLTCLQENPNGQVMLFDYFS